MNILDFLLCIVQFKCLILGVDNAICTYGGIVEFRKGLAPKLLEWSRPLKMLLVNTNVQRETKKMVSKAAALHHKYPDLTNNILNAMEDVAFIALTHLTSLCALMTAEGDNCQITTGGAGGSICQITTGGVGGSNCLITAGGAVDKVRACYEELGRLAAINHNLLGALGVSHLALDEVVRILGENGLQGKLTGAGGGGYAICLVPPYLGNDVLEKVMRDLSSRGFQAVVTDLGGNGVMVE